MLSDTGFKAGHGKRWGVPATEIADHSDLVVVWGCNPVSTHVNLMGHIARARKERGAKLVVVDPYRSPTAEQADMHLALRPGTDGALACGVMHILFRDGHADRDYLARYSDVPAELERHLASRTPEWAAAITGLPVQEIEAFARLYGGDEAQPISASATASPARATVPPPCTPPPACRSSPAPGRTRAVERSTISASSTAGTRR